jgi:tetratricopeptide (TPR) repeat protein
MIPRRVIPVLLCCLAVATVAFAANASAPAIRPNNNALAARGFDELYSMDYQPAIRDFTQLQREHPDDPFPSNYLLAAVLFQELYRIGALDTETYSGNNFLTAKARRPLDPAVQKQIFELVARVESQCNARLQHNPNDTDALYARGVARGFRSTYMGMAEKSWVGAIRSALASRRDHERVLELDPKYVDAKMTVGIHNYIIGSLNWAGRAAVALIGVTGNKQKGLDYLRDVSRSGSTSANDGAMALALFLRREQKYAEAVELVGGLARRYPRNFLLQVEYAHLLNAAGQGREAIAEYQRALDKGRAGQYSVFVPEMAAWGLGVSLRGQREFARAADAFLQVAAVRDADAALIDRACIAAGEMYDTVGQRQQAMAQYRTVVSGGHDEDYIALARKHLKHPYHFSDDSPPVK